MRNTLTSNSPGLKRASLGRIATLLLVLVLSLAIYLAWENLERLGSFGYPALFVLSLISSAAFLMPAPGILLVVAAGGVLDPVAVGIVAGMGAAIGELTGYAVGLSGQGVFEDSRIYWQMERWMQRSGTLVIFLLSAIPNPVFDLSSMIAGVLRMPVWRFVLGTWMGKSLRYTLLAVLGAATL